MANKKPPAAFKSAYHIFIFTEVLRPPTHEEQLSSATKSETSIGKGKAPESPKARPKFPKKFILDAVEQSSDEAGWAHLGTFGSYLTKLQPDFDSRLFDYKKLSDLVKAKTDLFLTEERTLPGQSQKVLYLRAK